MNDRTEQRLVAWLVTEHVDYEGSSVLGVFTDKPAAQEFADWYQQHTKYVDEVSVDGWYDGEVCIAKTKQDQWESRHANA